MANFITILTFLISCFVFLPAATYSSNETDLLSLLAFKSAIDLDPLGALISWNETLHFCRWNGVQCGRKHPDRVIAINLRSQGLVGSLSPHLGNLSFLRTIILQNNTFSGPIPLQITLLRRLQYVEFSNNSFSGSIPTNLSQCPHLIYLNFIDNELTGEIPTELGSLSKLEALGLFGNKLFGRIPPSIGNISSLVKLSLGSCGLKDEIPESFSRLQSLEFLEVGENGLTGTIPSGLFNISVLQTFIVMQNQLHGVIPSNIGITLPNLQFLYLWENQFSGPIPVSISNASLLIDIDFHSNSFTGPVPRVSRLTNLRFFVFASNLIEDDISFISSLSNSTKLEAFEVGDNQITGSLPDSISNLSSCLSYLQIHENKIHGNIPSGIENLVSLIRLSVMVNYLEGSIPTGITKLSNLMYLYAGSNRFTDNIPSSVGNLTLLNFLYLNENNLLGKLPSSIGNCTNLQDLDLSLNNFDGAIPPKVINLSSIFFGFNLSYNYFEGSVPYEVGSLTNLERLDLSYNRLSGLIPSSLGQCITLQQLSLEANLFEGEIPLELSALIGLQDLDLSSNNLSGPIPDFLANLKLEKLNLSFNMLQGEVPISGVFRDITSISLDGNKQLCGGISELKLPPCSPVESQKKNLSTLLKILIPAVVVGGIILLLFAFIICKQRMFLKNVTPPETSFTGGEIMRLSYADLVKATDGFSETKLLGVGRFGSVYEGVLDDGETRVAVKVLDLFVRGVPKSFMAECNALRNVRHRNVLKLFSVCASIDFKGSEFMALVYELKSNGSLENWLHHTRRVEREQNAETSNLNMIQRLNIAIDIAQALKYLHFDTDSSIVHGDLKPSNILLDEDMTAYVGDFGLSKILSNTVPSHESSSSIEIKGTFGYMAPEYASNNMVSTRGDMYSYGILLLEMFTNKRPTDEEFNDHVNLHNFVSNAWPNHVEDIVDPNILEGSRMNTKEIACIADVLRIGIACSRTVLRDRMLSIDVVRDLCKIRDYYNSY